MPQKLSGYFIPERKIKKHKQKMIDWLIVASFLHIMVLIPKELINHFPKRQFGGESCCMRRFP